MWNAAVIGDNDFMHHSVGRIGPADAVPATISATAQLDHNGDKWVVTEGDEVVARYDDDLVRLSVSWKAKVEDDNSDLSPITLDEVFSRIAAKIGESLLATSVDDLFDEPSQQQLIGVWPGYWPIPPGV